MLRHTVCLERVKKSKDIDGYRVNSPFCNSQNGAIVISAARNPEEFTVADNIGAFKYQLQAGVVSYNNK